MALAYDDEARFGLESAITVVDSLLALVAGAIGAAVADDDGPRVARRVVTMVAMRSTVRSSNDDAARVVRSRMPAMTTTVVNVVVVVLVVLVLVVSGATGNV